MNKLLLFCLSAGIIASCKPKPKPDQTFAWKAELMDADRSFSAKSKADGLRNAYMSFIDSNGVLLRPGNVPITGGNTVDFISQSNDSSFTMTWDPRDAAIAASGDLGYTFGVYSIKPEDADTVYYGTYVTIWKRQPDGKWKFSLQSANEGLE